MANENPATHEVVESEVIESVPVGEEANRSSNLRKNVGIVVLILACIFALVLAFAPKSPPEQANKIAEDNGYELIADDTVRSDSIAQGMLIDRLYPDAIKGDNERPSERAKHTIFDVGSKDGESYLLRIDLDDEKITKVKGMSEDDQYEYSVVSDTSKSFH